LRKDDRRAVTRDPFSGVRARQADRGDRGNRDRAGPLANSMGVHEHLL
jgi:hypothetical protein